MTAKTQEPCSSTSRVPASNNRRLFRLGALALGALFSLVVCEVGLRVYVISRGWTPNCYVGSIQLNVPHKVNGYTLATDHYFRSGVYEVSTNSLGTRGHDLAKVKPSGTKRIAVLGGSSVFGYLVSDGQTACSLLEQELNAHGLRAEVINAGVPGYNLFQSIERYQETIVLLDPDVVVLYLGWNDLRYLVSEEPRDASFRSGYCAPMWERLLSHSTMYGFVFHRLLARTANFNPPESVGGAVTPAGAKQFEANLNNLVGLIGPDRQVVVCSQASLAHPLAGADAQPHLGNSRQHAAGTIALGVWLQQRLRRFADDNELPFVDCYNEIPPTLGVLGDSIHLTAAGEKRLSRQLAERLKDFVR